MENEEKIAEERLILEAAYPLLNDIYGHFEIDPARGSITRRNNQCECADAAALESR